ncbi:S9 family peptidase [Microvirga sp. 17 mud 1-3]|uniref:alpha/beta hydrolase family protein n=1 Tax=Microvirga sp. 17 mud 1-3 TaxID=2082949 RepID=UPI000D6D4AC7|nr:alpha/beta fold hydrolase [Microvirga sp. 17 mud 1-3]AWM87294.1 alpha/beta hydrolase [Microvirga sp. 17 mud 1-3]
MGRFFRNDLHEEFGTWPLGYTAYGGADVGEIIAVAEAVGDGDDTAYFEAWMAAGDRLRAEAEAALERGLRASASELFLRASSFYATSYHPLYGEPVDARLVSAFRTQIAAFNEGLRLRSVPVRSVRIPFEDTSLPAYLIPAEGHETKRCPLLILTNGYDATVTEMYFASAVAACRRGYHCLIFDGPGQGEMLIEHGMRMRPDWDAVVREVVNFALDQDIVDPHRIVISGWSLGGFLAPRAAAGEPRLAACIADPGSWGIGPGLKSFAAKFGLSAADIDNLNALDQGVYDRMQEVIDTNPKMRWSIVQRGFWVHGVDNLRDYIRVASQLTLEGWVEKIRCPTLLTAAENDPLSAGAEALFAALQCPKSLIRFTAAEGAGDHCEMQNRSLLNRRVLDWLDLTLAGKVP